MIGLHYNRIPSIPIRLSEFHHLKTLKINAFGHPCKDRLKESILQNLEVFENNFVDYDTIDHIIKTNGGPLRKLLIRDCDHARYDFRKLDI